MSRFDFCALWVCCVWRQTAVGRLTVRIQTAPTARSKPEGDRGLPLTGLPSLARGSCVLVGVLLPGLSLQEAREGKLPSAGT